MKKYLFSALALPLLFACSSEDFSEQTVVSNDQFAGIEKVDATFSMADDQITRFDGGKWLPEEGDLWGFAWLGDGTKINPATEGIAYQNHNLIQTNGIFTPQTSIYVGKYYIYRPYDKTTVSPQAINFKSLESQPLAEGFASTTQAWKDLAKTAINIGDKWTNVTLAGTTDAAGKTWNKAGIKEHYNIYAAVFSNQTGLDLTYTKNNPTFAAAQAIAGATDINYTIAAGTEVGAADIYEVTVDLTGAAKSFTYAPTAEPNAGTHSGSYWADKSNLAGGFTPTAGAITLTSEDGVSTGDNGGNGWFWFNSLPVSAGNATNTTNVTTVLKTSYGDVTINKVLKDCAYAFEKTSATADPEWIKLAAATDETKSPKEWDPASKNTFVNQYGNHKGKYALTVDFSTGVMNNMKIKNDAHLQKTLKYYLASGKSENVVLNLEQASTTDNTFKLSKISIALLQTINASGSKVLVQPGTGTPKIIVTQDGQADLGLADKKEVPNLDKVFNVATDVYLASGTEWTWAGGTDAKTALTIDNKVKSITNEGTLTVNATNVELTTVTPVATLANAADATMNITKVTTVKNALTNLGTINVGASDNTTAELRAYGKDIKNDATSLTAKGVINNYGVVGVSAGTSGKFYNYGLIDMKDPNAITLLSSNEIKSGSNAFGANFAAGTNMMGTVKLPEGNPTALVSVSNDAENGFIEYTWTGGTIYTTPAGNVKYNTIVVSDDITFTATETEIQFIRFTDNRIQVVNPGAEGTPGYLTKLKGIIVDAGNSIIIEKTNTIHCTDGAYLGAGATVYKGGGFTYPAGQETANYFSLTGATWSTDQIVEW